MIDASPRRLHVFKTVVDLGGFNAAAARLGMTQPSAGAHVTALERQAGQSLLRRHRGARPQLTEAGRVVYDMAADILQRNEEAARQLAGLKARQAGEIVIAAHRDLALSFLPQRLGAFSRRSSRSRVVTRIGTIEDVLALAESGAVHLGLLLASGSSSKALGWQVVGHEPLDLVVAPSHPLAWRSAITAKDLAAYPFVMGLRHSRYSQIVERALRSIGVVDRDVALELQEATAVKEAVRHGHSVACLPRCTIGEELETGVLVALDLAQKLAPLQIRCVYASEPGPAAARLIAFLKQGK